MFSVFFIFLLSYQEPTFFSAAQAEADPAWAEANPFVYEVEQVDGGFVVHTNGWPGGVRPAKNVLQNVLTETIPAAESAF